MRTWRLVIVACSLSSASVQAEPPKVRYEVLVREAVHEFDAGNYVEARTLFEQAHAQKPSARTLRGLGSCAYELKHYVQAVSELEAALDESRNPLTAAQRAEVGQTLEKARRFVGKLVLELEPQGASVEIDAQAVTASELTLEAGDHSLTASAPGYRDSEQTMTVRGGETAHASVRLRPLAPGPAEVAGAAAATANEVRPAGMAKADTAESPSVLSRWWFWTAVGVVVAGAVTGTVLALGSGAAQPPKANAGTTGVLLKTP